MLTTSLPLMLSAMADPIQQMRDDTLNLNDAINWKYEMRREVQMILPGLYLGPYSALRDVNSLLREGVRNVVLIRGPAEESFIRPKYQDVIKTQVIDISDSPRENIISSFSPFKQFVDGVIRSGGKVLVACACGMSRGPAFVVAYVMETGGMTYTSAYHFVQSRRFCINPNDSFKHQLLDYEAQCKAKQTISHHPYTQQERLRTSLRRKATDELEESEQNMTVDDENGRRCKEARKEDNPLQFKGVINAKDDAMQL